LVEFDAVPRNPIFTARPGAWDTKIRERGWILKEGNLFHLWYTGYDGTKTGRRLLGYALSNDGLHWTRHPDNPFVRNHWVEDMMVVKEGDTYYMFAEGAQDIAQLLTSPDALHWTRVGPLDIRLKNGQPISPGPRGTPTVYIENGTWHLFYERGDKGVWLATSRDRQVWTNVQDEPVLALGPEPYDRYAVAVNQVLKHQGKYYAYYHGSDTPEWKEWNVNVAVSDDLRTWRKYAHNPLLRGNQSSAIVVPDGSAYRLYSMHNQVRVYLPKSAAAPGLLK